VEPPPDTSFVQGREIVVAAEKECHGRDIERVVEPSVFASREVDRGDVEVERAEGLQLTRPRVRLDRKSPTERLILSRPIIGVDVYAAPRRIEEKQRQVREELVPERARLGRHDEAGLA
jgi:hypothetical protein